ncbi:MAG: peroxiredoxin [Alphaproteobacteria bacterium]|jgi:alkyl hydroperoxide reductase subunit AhpC|nr:peroxiredoxin [Alphaproteobacteria bacterium]
MLTVGDRFPSYSLKGVDSNNMDFKVYTENTAKGSWKVYMFWPKDFTFVCPTEISSYGDLYKDFKALNTEVYGLSTDSEFVHLAWRSSHPALQALPYPMLSDITRSLSEDLGILHKTEGVCLRATFIVDPENIIRHVSVNDLSVGRSADETLRLVQAFQTGELTPCNWKRGEDVIKAA